MYTFKYFWLSMIELFNIWNFEISGNYKLSAILFYSKVICIIYIKMDSSYNSDLENIYFYVLLIVYKGAIQHFSLYFLPEVKMSAILFFSEEICIFK